MQRLLSAKQNSKEKQLPRNNLRNYFGKRTATESPDKLDHITVAYSHKFYRKIGAELLPFGTNPSVQD